MEGKKTFNEKAEKSTCKTAVPSVALNLAAERKVWITEEANRFLLFLSNCNFLRALSFSGCQVEFLASKLNFLL